jgi:hypothetical protein
VAQVSTEIDFTSTITITTIITTIRIARSDYSHCFVRLQCMPQMPLLKD